MKEPDMLSGLTAEQWSRPLSPLGKVVMSITLVAALAYFVTGSMAETVPPWMYALFALVIALFLLLFFVMIAFTVKASREAKAGYTTTGGLHPEVPQLDSRTGEVVRKAGQALTTEQRTRLRKRIK